MRQKNTLLFGLSLIVIPLFISCKSKPTTTMSPTAIAASTATPQSPLTPTTIPVPAAAATVKIETTSELVFSPTASPTITLETATPLPTLATPTIAALTPLPTLASDELEASVAELLANPMNCDMPCWWGTIPGVTDINEVKHAVSPYNFDIYEYEVDGENYLRLGIGRTKERNDFEVKIVFSFSNSILTGVTAYTPAISDTLAKYGQPDEVWFSAMNDPREQPPLIWFVIVYLQKGIGIGYVVDGNSQDDVIIGCVADENTERLRNLRLIVPESATSYKDFSTIFDKARRYLPLEEATGLTIEDFMQLFNDPTRPQCIETPVELWE